MFYVLLTFQSPIRHCRQLQIRIATFVRAITFDDYIDIIIERLQFIDLRLSLIFIDVVSQYLLFDDHLIFELSGRFIQVIQYE